MFLVSNFNGALLLDVMRYARIPPSVLQIEHHPYLVQQPLINLANSLGIAVTAYCSFGPASWIELGVSQKTDIMPQYLLHDCTQRCTSTSSLY